MSRRDRRDVCDSDAECEKRVERDESLSCASAGDGMRRETEGGSRAKALLYAFERRASSLGASLGASLVTSGLAASPPCFGSLVAATEASSAPG